MSHQKNLCFWYHPQCFHDTRWLAVADDNVYFDTDYRTIGGPGYVADTDLCDDGALHAGVSMWGIRDMVKRSATLQHVMGKKFTSLMFHVSVTMSESTCQCVAAELIVMLVDDNV